MAGSKKKGEKKSLLETFKTSDNKAICLVRELLWVAVVVGGIALALFLISGTWPAMVTIESESMVPNMNVGDLVFVVDADRFGELQSWAEGKITGYEKYGEYGDVLIYKPNGADSVHPIIHRAMIWVEEGQTITVTAGDYIYNYTAPHEGYITKGDNNPVIDQSSWSDGYHGLGPIEPVKEEWIVGKAFFAIPLVGYLPLNLIPVAFIIIAGMLLFELYQRRKIGQTESPGKGKSGKKKR